MTANVFLYAFDLIELRRPAARPARSAQGDTRQFTSSAIASSVGGIVRTSALAVVRLMMRSNLVGCSTGMSPGFVPRRNLVDKLGGAPVMEVKRPAMLHRNEG
jgi:hypothetical protein